MKQGDHVTWMHVPRGGYGYTLPVDAEIVKIHANHATVKVKKRNGSTVRRRVALQSLRIKPAKPKGLICKTCGCTLIGVEEVHPGSGVYDRQCPERDGDLCEAVVRR